jgi:ABC-type antimicrobial peptide transport system permease subunit
MKLLVRSTASDPSALVPAVRAAIRSLDPAQAVGTPTTISALLDESVAQPRFAMRLMLAFAGAGLALAALGIYGLLTFIVTLRTREIGVRMALGARTRDIVRIVLREVGPLAAAGAVAGAILSLAVSPVLRGLLFGVSPADPVSILAAPAVLGAVAAVASLLPARRAARVDPSISLRSE